MSQKSLTYLNRNRNKKTLTEKLRTNLFSGKSKSPPAEPPNKGFKAIDDEGNIVPKDPHQFYLWLGKIIHPLTKQEVDSYTSYQLRGWQLQLESDLLVVKSNKVGYSSSSLDALIQNCLLRKTAGYEKLIVCQTSQLAKEHLYTIRKRLIDSENGSKFLIHSIKERPYLIKGEETKIMELFIENPYNESDPSRIFGLGASAGSVVSWKRVNYVLASDITKSKTDYRAVLDGLSTRLANTRGRMHIETIPNGPTGRIYEMYEQILNGDITDMKLLTITADDAVKEGVITQEYLESEKKRLGIMYDQYFNADFIVGHGNVFRPDDIKACYEQYKEPVLNTAAPISMGIDPGFGSSKFAVTILQFEDNLFKVLYAKEWDRPSYENMVSLIAQLRYQYRPNKIFVDAAKPDFIKSLKIQFSESIHYEDIIKEAKKEKVDPDYRMFVCPVSFNEHGAELLGRFQHIVSKHWFSFSSIEHKELLKQMSSAQFQDNGNLDKAEVGDENTFDVFDSTRLALKAFEKSDRRR